MKKYLIYSIIAIVAISLYSCSESSEKYNVRAFNVADSIIMYSEKNFEFVSACQSMWRSVVFDSEYINPITDETSYCYDFNEGIARYCDDLSPLVKEFKKEKKRIDDLYGTVKEAPEDSKGNLEMIKELVTIYSQSYDMMTNPSGSLNTYTANYNDLYQKFELIKTKIEIEKK